VREGEGVPSSEIGSRKTGSVCSFAICSTSPGKGTRTSVGVRKGCKFAHNFAGTCFLKKLYSKNIELEEQ
jgi:hypothetical protein